MNSDQLKIAGQYTLDNMRLYKYGTQLNYVDLKKIVHTWEINESMDNGYLYGSATIYDSGGLLDNAFNGLGIVGEELLLISYTDWHTNEIDAFNAFVYAVTDLKDINPNNETVRSYTLHFVSVEKFNSNKYKVRRSFSGLKISDYVKTVVDDYFNRLGPTLTIEDTYGTHTLVVPNYSPDETLQFFARKAVSNVHDSQTFRFFQNRRGFHFCTHEYLIEQAEDNPIKYIRINEPDSTAEAQERLAQSIIDIEFPLHVNTFEDMNQGAYYHQVTELDINNRRIFETGYNYLENYSNYTLPDGTSNVRSKHSVNFIQNYFRHEPQDNLVIKDYHDLDSTSPINAFTRPYASYPDIYNKKKVNLYHHTSEKVTMKTYGRNDVCAGDVIEIDIPEVNSDLLNRKSDFRRSGKYLIESIKNMFHEEYYYQIITMSKSGVRGAPESFTSLENSNEVLTTLTNLGNNTNEQSGGNNNDNGGGVLV